MRLRGTGRNRYLARRRARRQRTQPHLLRVLRGSARDFSRTLRRTGNAHAHRETPEGIAEESIPGGVKLVGLLGSSQNRRHIDCHMEFVVSSSGEHSP